MKRLLLIGVAFATMLPMTAFARGRVSVFVGPRFGGFGWYGPYYGYPGYYGYWPGYGTPNAGQVKLDTKVKDAEVYINGNFAGTVGDLKTMKMRSGDYKIEIRAPGRAPFEQKVHVLAGKTLKLHPDLRVQPVSGPPES